MTLSTPAQFIQALNNHGIEPQEFCTHLLHSATTGDGTATPEDTAAEFGIDIDAAARLFRLASEYELIQYRGTGTDCITVNQANILDFLQFLTTFCEYVTTDELALLADEELHQVDLHVSVPKGFTDQSADLMARLIRLVRNAESELLLVTPFFTRFGVDAFVDHLAHATARGVFVTILTRDTDGDNAENVTAIRESVAETGDPTNLDLYDYDGRHGRLHAKALITDRERAYVGSANFTTYSLQEAIEIGLVVQGPVVMDLVSFFDTVRRDKDTKQVTDTWI